MFSKLLQISHRPTRAGRIQKKILALSALNNDFTPKVSMRAAVAVFYALCPMATFRPIRWKTFAALKRNPPHELYPFQRHTLSRIGSWPMASFDPESMTPRNILAAIPAVQVVEMKRNNAGHGAVAAEAAFPRPIRTSLVGEQPIVSVSRRKPAPELVLTYSALRQRSFNALEQSAVRT
jgi:hypothetical protein